MKQQTATNIDRVAAVTCLAVLGAEQQDFPSHELWAKVTDYAPWAIPALIVLSGVFALGPFGASAEGKLITRRTALQREVLVEFGQIVDAARSIFPAMPLSDVGIHVWQVRWRVRKHVLPLERYLRRVVTYRIGGDLILREFGPSVGHGAVGQCWKHNREVDFDVDYIRSIAPDETTYAQILQADPDSVMELTWSEFNTVSHRGSVFASPIQKRGQKFSGCVSLDFSAGHAQLKQSAIPGYLNGIANRLSAHSFEEM